MPPHRIRIRLANSVFPSPFLAQRLSDWTEWLGLSGGGLRVVEMTTRAVALRSRPLSGRPEQLRHDDRRLAPEVTAANLAPAACQPDGFRCRPTTPSGSQAPSVDSGARRRR